MLSAFFVLRRQYIILLRPFVNPHFATAEQAFFQRPRIFSSAAR